jgi:hypothetical protein
VQLCSASLAGNVVGPAFLGVEGCVLLVASVVVLAQFEHAASVTSLIGQVPSDQSTFVASITGKWFVMDSVPASLWQSLQSIVSSLGIHLAISSIGFGS